MHIETLGNGLGGQSMYLLHLAAMKIIPATVSITADTGAENDCLWNTGERTTAREYFDRVVVPLAEAGGIEAKFVRAKRQGEDMPGLEEFVNRYIDGEEKSLHIPVFGNRGGKLIQSCTDRWKIGAIKQELRRMGATSARNAIGIHANEFDRIKGQYLDVIDGWRTYQTGTTNRTTKVFTPTKWLTHYYPLVGLNMGRESIRDKLEELGIPYLISSECDFCPHKNWARWKDTHPDTVARIAELEARFNGEYFFTSSKKPLLIALEEMKTKAEANPSLFSDENDFGCENDVCGI